MNSEIKSKKWMFGGVALQLATGYTVSYFVYQIGTLITDGTLGSGWFGGLIAVAGIVAVVIYLINKTNNELKTEYTLSSAKEIKKKVGN